MKNRTLSKKWLLQKIHNVAPYLWNFAKITNRWISWILDRFLTLFHTGSGMTLSHRGRPLWPSLIFCYITQQKVALTPKTCSQIKFLIFRHPFTPLFQHSRESVPPFMSVNVNQHLDIETLKIGKTPKGPPFGNEKNFCLRFWWNSKHAILMA